MLDVMKCGSCNWQKYDAINTVEGLVDVFYFVKYFEDLFEIWAFLL
jgi:hypothetical protein